MNRDQLEALFTVYKEPSNHWEPDSQTPWYIFNHEDNDVLGGRWFETQDQAETYLKTFINEELKA